MLIQIVNGNTTPAMTEMAVARARAVAAPGTEILGATPESGPASIEGFYDVALAVPGVLAAIAAGERAGADAHVIGCFDDPGLDAARSLVRAPVVGMCEAAFAVARMLGTGFTVVTDLAISVPPLQRLVRQYGAQDACRRIRVAAVPVLELAAGPEIADRAVGSEIERALEEDGSDTIVLGCASLCLLAERLSERFGVPMVDGIGAAVKQAEALAALGLLTSKIGSYAPPALKLSK